MRIEKDFEQSAKSRDLLNVSILLIVVLCVGIYLILTTVIIAKDGITFINYAKRLETAPVQTMMNEFQHPGYPLLILAANKTAQLFYKNTSILSWIYCAQSVTLISRLLAIIVLYFIGKRLFSAGLSFWGTLIIILLPHPAEYGSDALSDWPHLFFLTMGLFLLFNGALKKRWWIFGFAGLAAGAGYLIRPECVQLVVLGILWLVLQLLWSKRTLNINKVFLAISGLMVGFMAIAGPYMYSKGAVFPKKNVGQFSPTMQTQGIAEEEKQAEPTSPHILQYTPLNIAKAIIKLVENIGETLMWFFVPAMFIGMYKWFKARKCAGPETFFVIAIIILNVPVMIWLYCKYGYMSYRHTLPLLILPVLYIPTGLQEIAMWCQKRFSGKVEVSLAKNRDERFWFFLLLIIGISICTPKLLRPIGSDKQGYRASAQWLKANTDIDAVTAVPDIRISFYAERKELVYKDGNIPANAVYIVMLINNGIEYISDFNEGNVVYKYDRGKSKKSRVAIYKR
jgi:hypothetical protein